MAENLVLNGIIMSLFMGGKNVIINCYAVTCQGIRGGEFIVAVLVSSYFTGP